MFVLSSTRQIPQDHPLPRMFAGVQGPNVAPPPQIGSIVLKQEYPERLSSTFASGVAPVPAVVLMNGIFVDAEQPTLYTSILNTLVVSSVVLSPVGKLFTSQEQPFHPLPRFNPAVIPGNVAAIPQIGRLVTVQELPAQPPSILAVGPPALPSSVSPVGGILVREAEVAPRPVLRFVFGVFLTTPTPLVTSPLLVKQEQPIQPTSSLAASGSFVAPAIIPPVSTLVLTLQERPIQSPSFVAPGRFLGAAAITLPSVLPILVKQEFQDHPIPKIFSGLPPVPASVLMNGVFVDAEQPTLYTPITNAGVQTPVIATSLSPGFVFGKAEVPTYSQLALVFGVQGPDVALIPSPLISVQEQPPRSYSNLVSSTIFLPPITLPPFRAPILTAQEGPFHPAPQMRASIQGPNVAAPPQIGEILITQEQPWHPLPSLRAILPPPIVPVIGTPETRVIVVKQELPSHPYPQMKASIQGPNVAQLPLVGRIQITQELPFHPGSIFTSAVIPGNVAALPQVGRLVTVQELPDHPKPSLRAPAPPSVALLPQVGAIVTTQEIPFHPSSKISPALIPGNVAALPQVGRLVTVQELPFHPNSQFNPSVFPPPPPVSPVGRTIGSQEQPYHPGPRSWSYPPTSVPFTGTGGQLMPVQEYPYHPPSMLFFTGYDPEFASPGPNFARLLFNTKIRVRTLVNKTPRTIRYN